MLIESIIWRDANEVQPDEGITVLLFVPGEDVHEGFLDTDIENDELVWRWNDASRVTTADHTGVVTHWADMPAGPKLPGGPKHGDS